MTKYEFLSLILTGTYDLLTLLILLFIIYEAIIKPRLPDIALYPQRLPQDTKSWTWITPYMDFVIENRGCDLQNVIISSIPDNIGWGKIRSTPNIIPKATSQYFKKIPYLSKNEKYQILWCDMHENKDVLDRPFKVIIEFDNPAFFIPKRIKKTFEFDFSAFDEVIWGANVKYDIHNVAEENARIREELEKISDLMVDISTTIKKLN